MPQQVNVTAASDAIASLHLDEATGEMVSKTELKKRIKGIQIEAKKLSKDSCETKTSFEKTNFLAGL